MKDILHPDPLFNFLSQFADDPLLGMAKFEGVRYENEKIWTNNTELLDALKNGYIGAAAFMKDEDVAIFRISQKGIDYKKALRSARDN